MTQPDHRRYIRYDALHLLDYQVINVDGSEGLYSMGRTLDVSIDGIQLETTTALQSGCLIRITIGLLEDLIDIEGRVIHCSQVHGRHVSGVNFLKVSKNGRRILASYIEAFNRRSL
jgi:c-di-GMP-binding flagellar brake protein YcgR